ncbi:MAG: amidohydrolase family protein [Spirochaetia bacterium]|nr:amidohydrolase family protein [Spirochaetia bacterium]
MPAGKLLEMVTVDAAQALGLQDAIGSIEAGKLADIILVDMPAAYTFIRCGTKHCDGVSNLRP